MSESLEIEPKTSPDLSLTIRSGWNKEVLLSSRARNSKVVEINECRTVVKHGRVQNIVKLQNRSQTHAVLFAKLDLTADIQIKGVKTRTVS